MFGSDTFYTRLCANQCYLILDINKPGSEKECNIEHRANKTKYCITNDKYSKHLKNIIYF